MSEMSTQTDLECSTSPVKLNGMPPLRTIRAHKCVYGVNNFIRDAWNAIKGKAKEEAMKEYVDKLVEVRSQCAELLLSNIQPILFSPSTFSCSRRLVMQTPRRKLRKSRPLPDYIP